MKPWVIVDVSYLAHRARYAVADLEHEEFHTCLLYNFWEQLYKVCTDRHVYSNQTLLCFDSRQSYRRRLFPKYKAHRKEHLTPEEIDQLKEMRLQVELLRTTILPNIGFTTYRQTGCESDDVMAQMALQITESNQQGIIITGDGDLLQCITPAIRWYDPGRRKLFDKDTFFAHKGVTPAQWGDVKALGGCSTDGVPGIPGVGEKTAIRYLDHKLPMHHKTYKAIRSPEGKEIRTRNEELVILPHPKTKEVSIVKPEYNIEAFFAMCERYGFLTYLNAPRRKEWETFFYTGQERTRKRKQ